LLVIAYKCSNFFIGFPALTLFFVLIVVG
jgi:hypothetical protein